MRAFSATLTAVVSAAMVAMTAGTADAACKKMGFLVNDYGKDGPTKDAQDLLDKHVAEWAAQNGIKNYTIGKKDVTCELYLDLILFDEHTCTASANVCWDEPGKEKPAKSAKGKNKDAPQSKAADSETKPSDKKASGAGEASEKAAAKSAEPVGTSDIQTGTVAATEPSPTAPAAADDAAARAAAAAERAAQAAERAAAAAEKAAATSKDAAPSQMEMPGFGAGNPASAAPETPVDPNS